MKRLQVAHAVAEMVAVARDSAGLGFALDHQDLAVDLRGQRGGGGQAGRSAADDRRPPTCWSVIATAPLARPSRALSVGAAVEALAAAVHHPGAAPQPVEIGRRDGGVERVADLAGGDPLAEADDAAVGGVGGDPLGVLVRAR